MDPLELVKLSALMSRTSGRREISVALIDGPVNTSHPALVGGNIQEIPGKLRSTCVRASSTACMHGTFVAGILSARRGSSAPAICPDCTLLVRPIFGETAHCNSGMPSAAPAELAAAIIDTIQRGAHVSNLSAALLETSGGGEDELVQALDFAAARGVITIAAAGNQGIVGSSTITRHPWVIAVVGCDEHGRPTAESNLGSSVGSSGLTAPGKNVVSLGTEDRPQTSGGTSAAAPFVTGAVALLRSEFPNASAAHIKLALRQGSGRRHRRIAPPLLNAWAAYQSLSGN